MSVRIQRQRMKGWRMPEGAIMGVPQLVYCGHAHTLESGTLGPAPVSCVRWFGRHETAAGMSRVSPLAPIRSEGQPERGVPPRAPLRSARRRHGVSARQRRYGSEGRPGAGSTRRVQGHPVYALGCLSLRAVRVCRSPRAGTRSSRRWWERPSSIASIWQRVLPGARDDGGRRPPRDVPGPLRQLQLDQASRARGMAVAPCR